MTRNQAAQRGPALGVGRGCIGVAKPSSGVVVQPGGGWEYSLEQSLRRGLGASVNQHLSIPGRVLPSRDAEQTEAAGETPRTSGNRRAEFREQEGWPPRLSVAKTGRKMRVPAV